MWSLIPDPEQNGFTCGLIFHLAREKPQTLSPSYSVLCEYVPLGLCVRLEIGVPWGVQTALANAIFKAQCMCALQCFYSFKLHHLTYRADSLE